MKQPDLFSLAATETVLSPLCSYQRHCGAMATLGPPQDMDGCMNCDIVCLQCGATGVQSTNKRRTNKE